jgi:hypothetical protein
MAPAPAPRRGGTPIRCVDLLPNDVRAAIGQAMKL